MDPELEHRHPLEVSIDDPRYQSLRDDVVAVLRTARRASVRITNTFMTASYWIIGRRIVEHEQGGAARAGYGESLLGRLSADLGQMLGRGLSVDRLETMRLFYLAYPHHPISATLSRKSARRLGQQSDELKRVGAAPPTFPLPWSHYVLLVRRVRSKPARRFYESEALRGGWSVRQLERQISTQFFERAFLSRRRPRPRGSGERDRRGEVAAPDQEIKDPFFLEFLDLKDEYTESEMERALVARLEAFLLELGSDFTFVGRQRRLRIGDQWYRIDLLFFHRRLRCLVVVDLKLGALTPADAGQMHMYLNYARDQWTLPGENPPVGLILCAMKDEAVVRYALEGLRNKVLAAEYRTALPAEQVLATELRRSREALEERSCLLVPRPGPDAGVPSRARRNRRTSDTHRWSSGPP